MDFLFGSMKEDAEFDKALDQAFDRLSKMPADTFVQQALMRSAGAIAGLSAAAVEGPGTFNTISFAFNSQSESERWLDQNFTSTTADWLCSYGAEYIESATAENDDDFPMLLAA
jgi:hypothetical protein